MNILFTKKPFVHSASKIATSFAATVVLSLNAALSHADLISSPYLPLSFDQVFSHSADIGGTFSCSTGGSYNAVSFDFSLTGACNGTGFSGVDALFGDLDSIANIDATIDNDGQLHSGLFTLFGTSVDLGITESTLLASGTLIDAHFGSSSHSALPIMQSLIELDFVNDVFGSAGDLLYWSSNSFPSAWATEGMEWQVSVAESDWSNFTGSQYFFYERTVVMPEPSTLFLFCLGLTAIGLGRKHA